MRVSSTLALVLLGLSLGAAACSARASFFLQSPWPEDQAAVLIVTAESGAVLEAHVLPRGPVRNVSLSNTEGSVRLYARTYAELARHVPVESCTVHLEEDDTAGDDLGRPSGAWITAPIDLGGGGTIALEPERDPRGFTVRVTGCMRTALPCDLISSFVQGATTYGGLRAVVALSPDSAIAGGAMRGENDQRPTLLRIDGETARALDPIGVTGIVWAMARHAGKIAGGAGKHVFILEPDGRLVSTTTVAFEAMDVATGADDTTLIAGDGGELMIMRPGSLALEPFPQPEYALAKPDGPRLAVRDANHILLGGPDQNAYVFEDGTWRRELPNIDGIDAVALDADTKLVVPTTGQTLLYRESTRAWTPIGNGFLTQRAGGATPVGNGRYLMVGQSGTVAYWNSEMMCLSGAATDRNLEDIDFVPGARTGYAAGESYGPNTMPALIRFEVPE